MNKYIIGYDKGLKKNRSSLIISKYNNSNLYVLAEFYDEKADLLNEIITNLQQENKQFKEKIKRRDEFIKYQQQKIDKTIELTKNLLKTENKGYYQIIFKEILKSLGGDENEN